MRGVPSGGWSKESGASTPLRFPISGIERLEYVGLAQNVLRKGDCGLGRKGLSTIVFVSVRPITDGLHEDDFDPAPAG